MKRCDQEGRTIEYHPHKKDTVSYLPAKIQLKTADYIGRSFGDKIRKAFAGLTPKQRTTAIFWIEAALDEFKMGEQNDE